MSRRPSYTDRRRALLARRVETLDRLENRSMITESFGLMVMGIGFQAAAQTASHAPADQPSQAPREPQRAQFPPMDEVPIEGARRSSPAELGADTSQVAPTETPRRPPAEQDGDWIPMLRPDRDAGTDQAQTLNWKLPKAAAPAGGGAAQAPRGGAGASQGGTISPLYLPPPRAGTGGASSTVVAGASLSARSTAPAMASLARPSVAAPGGTAPSTSGAVSGGGGSGGQIAPDPGLLSVGAAPAAGPANGSFPYFGLYTLDYNNGVVLFPGFVQYATPGGNVDLRAQVRDTSVSSYSWDTSGLFGYVTGVSGTSSYNLSFQWNTSFRISTTASASLTVTDVNGHQETQTYTFFLPGSSSGTAGTGTATWPQSLAPDTVLANADAFQSHHVSVDANSGALDTTISLPAYNPNVPGLVLTYDSLTADARPIVVEHHQLDPALGIPRQVSAQLTFDGTAGTTYDYNTSQFIPGDVQQIALQADATSLSTGRYAYSLSIGDVRGTTTTTTVNGSATALNDSGSALGAGWTVQGLERITAASGGVILDLGGGGKSLWFSGTFGSGGGTYTNPHGEFSTLVLNADGTYTRTLTDGTAIDFNASGQEVAAVDREGLRTTFAYSSGNLSTITDPYNNVTTVSYSGGMLETITDPASRVATFTHTGSDLTGVTLPDSSAWSYGYDAAGRLTSLTDPNSHTVTVAYDSAERVSTITRPDTSTESFTAYQERGWTNSGTALSPATPTLLAESRATYTDPLGNATDLRPDWNGEGLTNQATDASANVSTSDRDVNGLATIMIDRDNRITRSTYDSSGNPVTITYPTLNTDHYTYNSFSEPTTHTDGNGNTTTYTYDSTGNDTVIRDPLNNLATMTYTTDGKLATVEDANSHVTSYQYDSQDRLTTVAFPDGSTNLFAYDSKGNQTSATDGNGHATTYSFDALDRPTGMSDALGNPTTYVYDSGGNLTATEAPLSRTTSYAYDAMDRTTTVTDPLGHSTVTAYDSGGNVSTVTDGLGRVTTYGYNPENLPTAVTDPNSHTTTATLDAEGQTTQIQDPTAATTSYTYNSQGWVTTQTDANGAVTTYTYSGTGKLLKVSDPGNSGGWLHIYTYDADDRLISDTDAFSHTITYTYDGAGNQIAVTDGNNHTTSYAYDSMNRRTTVTDALGHATVYGYDSGGNQVTAKDALGDVTTTAYDALNRATTLTDPRGDQSITQYDNAGRQTAVIDPNGNRTTFGYDAADRLTTLTTPTGTTTYVYDAANELTDRTDADSRRVTFAYDSGGRQTGERWLTSSGGILRTVTTTYDSVGRVTGIQDPDATLTFTYDSGGNQVTAETSGGGGQPDVTLTSAYNGANERTSVHDNWSSPGTVSYTWDTAHRLSVIQMSGGAPVAFHYDGANNLTSMVRGSGGGSGGGTLNTTITYDAANRVVTITHGKTPLVGGSGGGVAIATYVYGYDNANRLTSEQNAEGTVSYTYDSGGQLTGASGSRAETYSYDSGGNRTMSSYSSGSANEMTASPGYTYTYDAEGNTTGKTQTSSGNSWAYTYDDRNRLTGATEKNSGGTVISQSTCTYDPMNRRIETQVDSDGSGPNAPVPTYTVYDGVNPWADFGPGSGGSGGSGTVLKMRYLYGPAIDDILARIDASGGTAWYLTDKLGTVRDIVNSSGSVLDHIVYDSYGNVISETSLSSGDRFKFAGMQYDFGTGLYFDNARYYDPSGGRFVGQDPKGYAAGDANLYRYVFNAPANAIDPTGEMGTSAASGGTQSSGYRADSYPNGVLGANDSGGTSAVAVGNDPGTSSELTGAGQNPSSGMTLALNGGPAQTMESAKKHRSWWETRIEQEEDAAQEAYGNVSWARGQIRALRAFAATVTPGWGRSMILVQVNIAIKGFQMYINNWLTVYFEHEKNAAELQADLDAGLADGTIDNN